MNISPIRQIPTDEEFLPLTSQIDNENHNESLEELVTNSEVDI